MDYEYSKNIDQATLWQYKQVAHTNDVRYLLILNDYKQLPEIEDLSELHDAWLNIYMEFSETTGGHRGDLWLIKQKQIVAKRYRLLIESTAMRMVQQFPHPDMIEELNKFGYQINADDFEKTFEKAYTRLMKLKNSLARDERESTQKHEKPDIDGMIIVLERFQGYQFSEKEMTLRKFANIYKAYNDGKSDK